MTKNQDGLFLLRREKGVVKKLADHFGISTSAIYAWTRVPSERVIAIEQLVGISRTALRPDLYPAEKKTG